MLRFQTLTEIQSEIAASNYFRIADFSFKQDEGSLGTVLRITYQYNPAHHLVVTVPRTKSEQDSVNAFIQAPRLFTIEGEVSPGELSVSEPVTFQGMGQLKQGISAWLKRVLTEIQTAPEMRRIAEQERQLAEFLLQMQALPDEYFSKEEATVWVAKLEDLERRLEENLVSSVSNKEQLAAQIKALKADIQMLKDNIETLKKPGWVQALCVRSFEWMKVPENRVLLRAGAEVVKGLLPEHAGHTPTPDQ
jgi:hypothetical protein